MHVFEPSGRQSCRKEWRGVEDWILLVSAYFFDMGQCYHTYSSGDSKFLTNGESSMGVSAGI